MFKLLRTAIKNLWFPQAEDTKNEFFKYGVNNQLPNELLRWVNDSGIAKRCINKIITYTTADGFTTPELNEIKVNERGETALELTNQIAAQIAHFRGFALLVGRNGNGEAVSFKTISFEKIRKRLDGDFSFNKTLGTDKFKSTEWKHYPKFRGMKITLAELNLLREEFGNVGEIWYHYTPSPDSPNYPTPEYYAGIEDLRSAAEIARYDLETALNGFVPSALLTIVGNIDNTVKDEFGRTQKDYLEETLNEFTGAYKGSDGLSNRAKLLVLHAATKEEIPNLQAFNAQEILNGSVVKRDSIERTVCRHFGIHPVLMGFSDASVLGNTQSIANASIELNTVVAPFQKMIENFFSIAFPQYEWNLSQFKPIQTIPIEILNDLTINERRALYGYSELPQDTTQEKLLAEKLGVGGTQSMIAIISDPVMTPETKSNTLQILFSLTVEDANKLAGVQNTLA